MITSQVKENTLNGEDLIHHKEIKESSDKKKKMKVRCYNCNNFGHYASDCLKSNHEGKQANLVQEEQEDDEPTLLMLQIEDSDTQKICEDIEEYVHVKEDRIKKDGIREKG
ncbi:hypothetical protein E3N88_34797 [Mikania micrantha]|uniref:CCHC-type domain-containing protein n=1 Tax=Mikania micrantha TaxID=192012 RepID=A0A5N6LZ59_9ASTR|nr:hypothetical protein E3N88_34797 [Mikania micrantha]